MIGIGRRGKPVTHADFGGQKRDDIDAELRDEGWESSGKNKSKIRVPGGKTVGGGLKGVAGSQKSSKRAALFVCTRVPAATPRNRAIETG